MIIAVLFWLFWLVIPIIISLVGLGLPATVGIWCGAFIVVAIIEALRR